jgi:hypothetical protein
MKQWSPAPLREAAEGNAGTDTTTASLRDLIPHCSACKGPLDDHAYRFFSSHPSMPRDAANAFFDAVYQENWPEVLNRQLPSVDRSLLVLYAIACPWGKAGSGMIALVLKTKDPMHHDKLLYERKLAPDTMSALRAVCATCTWIEFNPPQRSGEIVQTGHAQFSGKTAG